MHNWIIDEIEILPQGSTAAGSNACSFKAIPRQRLRSQKLLKCRCVGYQKHIGHSARHQIHQFIHSNNISIAAGSNACSFKAIPRQRLRSQKLLECRRVGHQKHIEHSSRHQIHLFSTQKKSHLKKWLSSIHTIKTGF